MRKNAGDCASEMVAATTTDPRTMPAASRRVLVMKLTCFSPLSCRRRENGGSRTACRFHSPPLRGRLVARSVTLSATRTPPAGGATGDPLPMQRWSRPGRSDQAAVRLHHLPRHPGRVTRGQEAHHLGDLLGPADAVEGAHGGRALPRCRILARAEEVGVHRPRRPRLHPDAAPGERSEEHTSELQSLMRISY